MELHTLDLRSPAGRLEIESLEARVAPSHLGHEVFLPQAAAAGAQGIQTSTDALADHHKARLIPYIEQDNL